MRNEFSLKPAGSNKKIFNIVFSSIFILLIYCIPLSFCGCTEDPITPSKDNGDLKTVDPEEVGYSSVKLEEAKDFAETSGFDAVIALHNGKIKTSGLCFPDECP